MVRWMLWGLVVVQAYAAVALFAFQMTHLELTQAEVLLRFLDAVAWRW